MSDINRDDQLNITESVDTLTATTDIGVSDQLDLVDNVNVLSVLEISVSDQLNITESVDALTTTTDIGVSDQLNITEDTAFFVTERYINVSDQLNITEDSYLTLPTLEIGVYDLLNITESVLIVLKGYINVADDLTLTENIELMSARAIGVNSSLSISEETQIASQFITVHDAITVAEETNEVISDLNINIFDLSEIIEVIYGFASGTEIGVLDQLNYADACSVAAPFSIGVKTTQRHVIYKLYDHDNTFIRVLNDVISNIVIEKSLSSSSGPINLVFKAKVDELPSDITFNNKIKIYIKNKWNSSEKLVYYGYIVSIDPNFDNQIEYSGVTCLGVAPKLMNDFLRTGDDLAYEITLKSIDGHIKDILKHYREQLIEEHGSAARSMLVDPETYWWCPTFVEDSSAIGLIPYRYFNRKHLDAIRDIAKFLPKNDNAGAFWYWFIDDDGQFNLKVLSTTPDHSLILGKHCTFTMRNNIENVVNRVFFWNERGDYAGERVRTRYEDTTSIDDYDVIAANISDSQVSTHIQGRLLAEGKLFDQKDNRHEATVVVSEAQYDILSFKLGQVVKIINTNNENLFSQRMIIQKIVLGEKTATLSLSTPRPDLSTQVETDREFIEKQLTWFGAITTRIDGTRIYTGVQHWTTEDIVFTPNGNDGMQWTAGSFVLPSNVRRVITAGSLTGMDTAKDYYVYLDEENIWCTKDVGGSAIMSGTGIIRKGENVLVDEGASWETDQHKGHVLWVDLAVSGPTKYIITRNTTTVLYIEGYKVFREDDNSVSYEIHKFVLKSGWRITAEGDADSGTTTTLVDSSRTEGNNYWDGYKIKILSGSNAGTIRTISSFESNTFTFAALPYAIAASVRYSLYLSSETQILIAMASPSPVIGSNTTIVPQIAAVIPEYQCDGATRAYEGMNSLGDLIRDIINDRLNTQTSEILSGFSFGISGAINIPGFGSAGVWISPAGILGKDTSGSTTFAITASNGSATFKGTVAAGSVIAANIAAENVIAGTFIGFTFKTAAAVPYVLIGGGTEWIKFYDLLGEQATLYAYDGSLLIHGARINSNVILNTGDEGVHIFTSGWNILGYMTKGVTRIERALQLPVFGWSSSVTSGTGKYYIVIDRRLHNTYLHNLHARHLTAGSGAGSTSIQIYDVTFGRNLLSTTLKIDSGHLGSETSATPYIVDDETNQVREYSLIRVDVSSVPATAPKGLILTLGFACHNSWAA